nr:hypothetical protein [Pseudomonas sp. FEMGT703P]
MPTRNADRNNRWWGALGLWVCSGAAWRRLAPLADTGVEQIQATAEAQQAEQILPGQARQPSQRHTDEDQRRQAAAEDNSDGCDKTQAAGGAHHQ